MSTRRVEAFSDGVFAIAITLLILTIEPPNSGEQLGHELLRLWPSYLAYAVSFLTIGIMWVNHHTVFTQIDRVDRTFLFINVGLMLLVAFVPFPTRLVAENLRGSGAEAAALTYGITLTITAGLFSALWFYPATGRRLLREDADPKVVSGISRSYLVGLWMYPAATLVALASPRVSVALYGAIAAFFVLESSLFGRE